MSEIISEAVPSLMCSECGKSIDPLTTHLTVTVKARKFAFFTPAPDPDFDPEEAREFEEEAEGTAQLGTRSGVGEEFIFHSMKCFSEHFMEDNEEPVQLRYNTDDSDPYNQDDQGGEEE